MKDATDSSRSGAGSARVSLLALVWATAVVVAYLAVRELSWMPIP